MTELVAPEIDEKIARQLLHLFSDITQIMTNHLDSITEGNKTKLYIEANEIGDKLMEIAMVLKPIMPKKVH